MSSRSFHRLPASLGVLFSLLTLASCGSAGSGFSYQNVTVTVTPQIASLPVNGTVTFTSTTTNAPNNPLWTIGVPSANVGTLTSATAGSATYTAPATPPVYTYPSPEVNGTVTLSACSPGGGLSGICATQTFVITAPSVTVGLSPMTATVKLGTTEQFIGYAVGSVNNALTWQVNGVTGGSAATGSIMNTGPAGYGEGLYTAPAVMPMSGNTVTITMISQADPTKTQTAIVTLQ